MIKAEQPMPSADEWADAAVSRGLALHSAGRLADAEAVFRAILERQPKHLRALALLGTVCLRRNEPAEALRCIEDAIAINPRYAPLHNERGNALQALGRSADALASYAAAVALAPGHADALNNRGNLLQSLGRHAEAIASYDAAIAASPGFSQLFYNRANALQALERHQEAIASYDHAIAIRPDYDMAFNNRGISLQALGLHEDAFASYEHAIELAPANARAHLNRGNLFQSLGRYDDAVDSYERALALDPQRAELHANRGAALHALERYEEAIASYDRAIALKPDHAEAHNNRGNAFLAMDRQEEALSCYLAALDLVPGHSRAVYNRGKVLQNLGRHGEALSSYDEAIALDPDYASPRWSKSLLLLLRGELPLGLQLYEWRWRYDKFPSPKRDFAQPLWLGDELISGKTILLHAEQGYGDAIHLCRYVPRVSALGATVILEVPGSLVTLMTSLEGVDRIVASGDALPGFDFQTPLASLPLAFRTRLDTVPAEVPYLKAPFETAAQWSERLGAREAMRVGLAWSGNPNHSNDRNRSIALADLLPLSRCGVELIGLQKEPRPKDAATLEQNPEIRNFGPDLRDFADTAAVIEQLDLVVSADTSIAHLAGALGKPVWIMLPHAPDWRWLLEREDSPWYPTAQLFRQASAGDWAGVVARVAAALRALTTRPCFGTGVIDG
jgi:tetratricopeptide (TPR) repeat protein